MHGSYLANVQGDDQATLLRPVTLRVQNGVTDTPRQKPTTEDRKWRGSLSAAVTTLRCRQTLGCVGNGGLRPARRAAPGRPQGRTPPVCAAARSAAALTSELQRTLADAVGKAARAAVRKAKKPENQDEDLARKWHDAASGPRSQPPP
jgi:hypothetical protein